MFSNFFSNIVPFMRYFGKKYTRAGQATGDSRQMHIAVLITKAANTHPEY